MRNVRVCWERQWVLIWKWLKTESFSLRKYQFDGVTHTQMAFKFLFYGWQSRTISPFNSLHIVIISRCQQLSSSISLFCFTLKNFRNNWILIQKNASLLQSRKYRQLNWVEMGTGNCCKEYINEFSSWFK